MCLFQKGMYTAQLYRKIIISYLKVKVIKTQEDHTHNTNTLFILGQIATSYLINVALISQLSLLNTSILRFEYFNQFLTSVHINKHRILCDPSYILYWALAPLGRRHRVWQYKLNGLKKAFVPLPNRIKESLK